MKKRTLHTTEIFQFSRLGGEDSQRDTNVVIVSFYKYKFSIVKGLCWINCAFFPALFHCMEFLLPYGGIHARNTQKPLSHDFPEIQ